MNTTKPTERRRRPLSTPFAAAIALAVAAIVSPAPASAESLEQAMIEAYSGNPTLLAQRAALRVLDESVSSAVAGWRPTVSLSASASQTRTNTHLTPGTSFSPQSLSLSLSQKLYRGGRTVAGIREAEYNVLVGRDQLRTIEQQVLLGTVRAYLDVLRDQALVQLNQGNVQVLAHELEAARDRFEVGEVARTDVSQSEARLSRAISDLIQAEGNLESSRATYASLVGHPPGQLERVPPISGLPASQEEAIGIALQSNPTFNAATNTERSTAFDLRQKRGVLLPSLTLSGDLTHSLEASSRTAESDSASITATLSIPLYQSGSEYSDIRKALQTNNQRRIEVEKNRRSVVEDVTQAWERLNTASSRIRARADEVAASEIALEGVRQEAEAGTRTTLDVLNAEQELLDARTGLVTAERDEYVAAFDLRSAIGRLGATDLGLPVVVYNAEAYYLGARNRLFGVGISEAAGE